MSSPADRMRAHRERRRRGLMALTVIVDEADVVSLLTTTGVLSPWQDYTQAEIADGLARLLDIMSAEAERR